VFARVHVHESTPEQQQETLRVFRDEVLPWLRDSTGFRGVIRLTSAAAGKAMTITLWATEDDLRESGEAAERFGQLLAVGTGAIRQPVEDYEISLLELPAGSDRTV
jgi:heme-degrading monooxygenase HmoA